MIFDSNFTLSMIPFKWSWISFYFFSNFFFQDMNPSPPLKISIRTSGEVSWTSFTVLMSWSYKSLAFSDFKDFIQSKSSSSSWTPYESHSFILRNMADRSFQYNHSQKQDRIPAELAAAICNYWTFPQSIPKCFAIASYGISFKI